MMIEKNEQITKQELENIRRKVLQREKYIEVNNNDDNKATQVDRELKRRRRLDPGMIQDILDLMKGNSGMELRRFNKVDSCKLPNGQGR